MRQTFLLLSLSINLILSFSPVQAADPALDITDKRDPVLIYREAGASTEQEAKIRQFAQEYEQEGKVRVERIHNLSRQLKELSFEAELDEKKILSLQDEINELQNVLNKDRIKLMLKIRGALSAEQRAKLVEILKEKPASTRQQDQILNLATRALFSTLLN